MGRRLVGCVAALALLLVGAPFIASPADAVSPDIVISQVYGGGGNTGATYKNDFIELFNRGGSDVNVTGWSVQYASAAGTTWQVTTLSGWLRPGRYYLIQEAAGAGGTTNLPTPHAIGNIAMSANNGKVALVTNTVALTGSCPLGGAVRDFVGYGTANCSEGGTTAPGLVNTTADLRASAGTQDTDINSADFASGAPTPRDTADFPIKVTSTTPVGANVPLNTNIGVTFSENANVGGTWFTIACAVSGAHTATYGGGPITFTIDPAVDFAAAETCAVTVLAAQVTDQDTDDPPDQMPADFVFSFTTLSPPVLIREIQGATHISPKNGLSVAGVAGIVTGKSATGFWMQDPNPDSDLATSEGIFVFTSTAPTVSVGDAVTVTGKVQEFRPGGSGSSGLTITEIGGGPTVAMNGSGNPLPAAILIGAGRMPPTEVIEDDASPDVETSGLFDPANDGIDFWESLEGMRVDLGMVVVTGPSRFDELGVLANDGSGATGRTARGGIVVSATDKNPEKVHIRGIGFDMPDSNTGDHFTASIVGIVDYDFGNFMIDVFAAPTRVADGVAREIAALPGLHELTIATFNVENLDPGDGTFATMANLIVNNLRSPDIISLEEIQDNNGETNTGIVDATTTLTMLRDAIVAAGGPTYSWREIDPVNNQDGGAQGGNIRQVLFFRTDRGVAFVDRPGAGPTTPNTVVNASGQPQLQYSPGRIDPANSAFNGSRKPLAGEFTYNGHHLFVIANHLNSKGGDDPLWGHAQPPVLSSEVQRQQQADILKAFVQQILAIDASAEIVLLGDLNDFEYSNPVMTLKSSPLNDLIETLPANERYSYVFEGNSQTLDHILVSNRLLALGSSTDVVHVNAEFWDQASDHDPQVATVPLHDTTPPTWATFPSGVTRTTGPAATMCGTFISDADLGAPTATDDAGAVTITRSALPIGNIFPVGSTTITYTATDASGNTATGTQLVTVIDNTPPVIAGPADAYYQLVSDVPAATAGDATATDNCGPVTISVSESNNGGAGTPASPLVIIRMYTTTDGAGNTAAATQTITVIDTIAPIFTFVPADLTRGTGPGATSCGTFVSDGSLGLATATDNSAGPVTISRAGVPTGNVFPVGVTTITYTATDAAGNTTTAAQQITVFDNTPPLITAPANATYQLLGQVPPANASDATASDNCGPVTITVSESNNGGAGSPSSPLIITRTYTATDSSGNSATAIQTITVIADTASLCQLVHAYVTKDGVASSLCAKLDAAAAARARGSVNAHDNQIQAFINEVDAQRGKSISDANANTLISLAGGL